MWSNDPAVWQMAAEMCADDACFWSQSGGLSLVLCTNDYFAPAADVEYVAPAEVADLYAYWKIGEPMKWAEKKTGLKPWRLVQRQGTGDV